MNYLTNRLAELGVSPEQNSFQTHYEGHPQSLVYFSEDKAGNIEIIYRNLDGSLQVCGNANGKEKPFVQKRLHPDNVPAETKMKYQAPTGAGMRLFYSPKIIQAFQQSEPLELLVITEGAFKAFKADMHGLPCVGSMGIHTLNDKKGEKRLNQELKELIDRCEPQAILFLFDSDLYTLSGKEGLPDSQRPYSFFKAANNFKHLVKFAEIDMYFGHICSEKEKMGLDDLLIRHQGAETEVLEDLRKAYLDSEGKGQYFQCHNLSGLSDAKLKALFGLENEEAFYQKYQAQIEHKFRLYRKVYSVADGRVTLAEIHFDKPKINERDGVFWKWVNKKEERLSNFTFTCLYQIYHPQNGASRVIKAKNIDGIEAIFEISVKEMGSNQSFQIKLEEAGPFFWKGTQADLGEVKEVKCRHVPFARSISTMGYDPETQAYVFANGAWKEGLLHPPDQFGVIRLGNIFLHVPGQGDWGMTQQFDYQHISKFQYIEAPLELADWVKQVFHVYQMNGHYGICFWMSCVFRDLIFTRVNFFPLLFTFGKKGSGKSKFMLLFQLLFGKPQDKMNLGNPSTMKGKLRRFGQFRNAMLAVDEYKNSLPANILEMLKAVYDGDGYERAVKSYDNRTQVSSIFTGLMISGQEMPTGEEALLTRVILLSSFVSEWSESEIEAFESLHKKSKVGISGFTANLWDFRSLVEQHYDSYFEAIGRDLRQLLSEQQNPPIVPDRLIVNYASILSILVLLIEKASFPYPVSRQEMLNDAVIRIIDQAGLVESNDSVQDFWRIIPSLIYEGTLKESILYRIDPQEDILYIRYNEVFNLFVEKWRRLHGSTPVSLSTLRKYLENSTAYLGTKATRLGPGHSPKRCMSFTYSTLEIDLNFGDHLQF